MKILALELSSARGSVAWMEGEEEPFVTDFANDRKHSGPFFEALQLCIRRFGQPERIVVGLGPGSYAGTRIAIAAGIGLRTVADAELIGLSSARAMIADGDDFAVVGDARRNSFYFARVQKRRCIGGPVLCDELELRERIITLDIPVLSAERLSAFPSVTLAYPSALILAQLGGAMQIKGSDTPLEPIYLREAHITTPKSRIVKITQ